MRKHWAILALLLAYSWILDAQRNNIWYFGRKAGLNFNQPAPVPLLNSAMNTDEGCSSICDANGHLLFYTNGVTVFDRNHKVMLNGEGLSGNISTSQSGLIVPHPGNHRNHPIGWACIRNLCSLPNLLIFYLYPPSPLAWSHARAEFNCITQG